MEKTAEQVYTDLLRLLARPEDTQPGILADAFSEVEQMHSIGQIEDWQMENAREAYARTGSAGASRVGDAAGWVMDKAKSAAEQARERATTVVATYTEEDPIRAILIAAAVGALSMGLLAMTVRSGVRSVKRKVQG